MNKIPEVALLIETSTSWGAQIIKGIADYVRDRANWAFYVEPHGIYEQLYLPEPWNGDGIIARVTSQRLADQITAADCPAADPVPPRNPIAD